MPRRGSATLAHGVSRGERYRRKRQATEWRHKDLNPNGAKLAHTHRGAKQMLLFKECPSNHRCSKTFQTIAVTPCMHSS